MASVTIDNIEDVLEARLYRRAAAHGRSVEDEARDILRAALTADLPPPANLADAIRARVALVGGVDLDIPPREPIRVPIDFGR